MYFVCDLSKFHWKISSTKGRVCSLLYPQAQQIFETWPTSLIVLRFWELIFIYKNLAWYLPQSKHSVNFSSKVRYQLSFYFTFCLIYFDNLGRTSLKYKNVYWMLTICKALCYMLCGLQTQCLCHIEPLNPAKEIDLRNDYIIQGHLQSYQKRHSLGQGHPDEGAVQLAGGWNACLLTNWCLGWTGQQ